MEPKLRIDKWLWAVRFFKTRSLATAAISAGHVELNGQKIKPSHRVQSGDIVKFRRGDFSMTCEVLTLQEKRVSAPIAQACYTETEESRLAREAGREQRAIDRIIDSGLRGEGRPDKHQRRALKTLKEQDN
ncbi:MAG: RNA-binding S4 domain-containing protein [Gammaproteobacteria bacterium]|nr:RNA-binding S4 domain-containing protein [Gammaproteobacteria bacterium]